MSSVSSERNPPYRIDIMNYEDALKYIHHVSWRGSKPGLSRTRELLTLLGNPQDALRFIHIAGTNGKGSTAAMTAGILRKAGYRTGLYISPFIHRFNERMSIDGEEISDEELGSRMDLIRDKAEQMADAPTEFELITALAFCYFKEHRCDVVVLEVGMGGELDSTNVISVPELAVITAIGLDHTRELGSTLELIASAKAGIIKPGGDVVSYGANPPADGVIAERCAAAGARLTVADFSRLQVVSRTLEGQVFDFGSLKGLTTPLLGAYQLKNAAVVLTMIGVLHRKGWIIPEEAIRKGLAETFWTGRMELLSRRPLFFVDGSHNPQGIAVTMESLDYYFPDRKLVFLLGMLADKDVRSVVELLAPRARMIVTTTPPNPRAMSAEDLAALIRTYTDIPVHAGGTPREAVALTAGLISEDDVVFTTGDLYMLEDISRAWRETGSKRGQQSNDKRGEERTVSMTFSEMTIGSFTEALASKAPVPGGGGASALAGAIGTALGNMVGNLTLGKKKYAGVQADMERLIGESQALEQRLLAMMDEDARAFEPLSRAYGLPAATEEEKAEKARVMEEALVCASEPPLHIMEAACEAIRLLEEFAAKGTAIAISDAGVGAVYCRAALQGASLNVFINTKAMKNRDKAEQINAHAEEMLRTCVPAADRIFAKVRARF